MSLDRRSMLFQLALGIFPASWAFEAAVQTRGDRDRAIATTNTTQTEGTAEGLEPADWEPILLASPSAVKVPPPEPPQHDSSNLLAFEQQPLNLPKCF